MDNQFLIYVRRVGFSDPHHIYEFCFSESPENVWGVDWDAYCPGFCENLEPDPATYGIIKRINTIIPMIVAQENTCFPFSHCVHGIFALAYEDISDYEQYPEEGRLVFQFGEKYQSVENKLAARFQLFVE